MIRRLPQLAFALLALATLAAFFLVQALKTRPPLVWTLPVPKPTAFNPIDGRPCLSSTGELIDYRHTTITISVSHADTVGVYIVSAKNPAGNAVATVSSGTPMAASRTPGVHSRSFTWNGRLSGGQPASDGLYYFRIVLEHQGRSANISQSPVQVITRPPAVRVLGVSLIGSGGAGTTTTTATSGQTGSTAGGQTGSTGGGQTGSTGGTNTTGSGTGTGGARGGGPASGPVVLSPPLGRARITFTRGTYRRVWIDIYRTDVSGGPELVAPPLPVRHPERGRFDWNGEIGGEPAPAGTYLVGITAQDMACNRAQWPSIPPLAGTTAHAGVTVRYLSVTPPLTPTVAGARASVAIDSTDSGFSWRLRRAGSSQVVAQGGGPAGKSLLRVRLPRHRAALYTLRVRAGTQSATVPLIASAPGSAGAHARVLVALPMLTWMGDSPVDDTGDGLPDTLRAGDAVSLVRPLVDGPPAGFGEDARLLAFLQAHHLSYQLTTDIALAEGSGPSLADRGGVVFPQGENYLPTALGLTLRGFVRGGGRLLVLGTGAFSGISHVSGFPTATRAGAPRLTLTDLFGAGHGPVTPTGGELISSVTDDAFGLFHNAGEFAGFNQYQPIRPPAGTPSSALSTVGIGSAAPAIVAFHYGSGTVVEIGLSGFAASLAQNADSDNLLANVWQLLSQ